MVAVAPTEMRRSASHIAAAGGEYALTNCAVKMVPAHMGAATNAAPMTRCTHVLISAFTGDKEGHGQAYSSGLRIARRGCPW